MKHQSSVTLEDVRNVDDFVEKLDRLELPNQLAAVLDDPLLQNLLSLRPSGKLHSSAF
jgi:centromere protein I